MSQEAEIKKGEELNQQATKNADAKETKVEDEDDDEDSDDHEGHDHHDHEGHDHAHDDKDAKGGKQNKGEKKLKKAMSKLGMKPVTDITRVTLRKAKSLMLYIDNPEVMKSPGAENTYIIFGEAKINDMTGGLSQNEAEKYAKPEKAVSKEQPESSEKAQDKPAQADAKEDNEPLDETGLDNATIDMVVQHTQCTRNAAIKALRETDGDSVTAIINLTK